MPVAWKLIVAAWDYSATERGGYPGYFGVPFQEVSRYLSNSQCGYPGYFGVPFQEIAVAIFAELRDARRSEG